MVLTDTAQADQYPAATMETANSTTENLLYGNINNTRIAKPAFFADPLYTTNAQVARVKNTATTQKIGPNIILKVMAGDSYNIRVASGWNSANPATNSTTNVLTSLLSLLTTGTAGASGGKATATELQNASSGINTGLTNFMSTQTTSGTKPKAYLNWVLLDEQFKIVTTSSGFEQVGASGTTTIHVKQDLTIPKSGYLYIYTSNEATNIDVYFDNLQVTHNRGQILEETHYYPFGLTIAGISSKAAGGIQNNYKFNDATELNNDLDINFYETEFRIYDAQIGRFHQVDELSDFNYDFSTYAFANNNPILMNDPLGLESEVVIKRKTKEKSTKEKPKTLPSVVVVGRVKQPEATKLPPQQAETKPSTAEKVADVVTDCLPFVGGGKDIYNGIRDGDGWQIALGVGSIALDFFTAGGASVAKGVVKNVAKEGIEMLAKEGVETATKGIVKNEGSRFLLNEAINVTEDRFIKLIQCHYPRSGMFLAKSKFLLSAREMVNLIKRSSQIPKRLQRDGKNFERFVDAGYNIGIDATTGKETSVFTIITNSAGDLITSFPGFPTRK